MIFAKQGKIAMVLANIITFGKMNSKFQIPRAPLEKGMSAC
jgi:hypothetical protein